MAQQPHKVFVSHAHADNDLCDRYVAALRARSLDVWYDRTNLQGGQSLSSEIERELEQRTAFVVMLTPASLASYWVRLETDAFRDMAAHDPTRKMLPVRMSDCAVPPLMRGLLWIDAVQIGFEAAIEELATALGAPPAAAKPQLTLPPGVMPANPFGRDEVISSPLPRTQFAPLPRPPAPKHAATLDELLAHGRGMIAQKLYTESIPFLEHATKRYPHSFDAWANLGFAYIELNRLTDGLAAYEQALSREDKQAWVWNNKGVALYDLNRPVEALAAYDRALALDPKYTNTWYNKGIALQALGRHSEAEQAEKRAKELG